MKHLVSMALSLVPFILLLSRPDFVWTTWATVGGIVAFGAAFATAFNWALQALPRERS